jgi:hypothetical protein
MIILSSQYQFESLQEDFIIFDDYIIPADQYDFWSHYLQLMSAKRRNFWAGTRISHGGFYSGSRTSWLMQLGYKVLVPIYLGLESDLNFVDLPEGYFETQIYRFNLNLLFGPNVSL